MAIKSACSNCGHVYTLADEFLGKKVRCKQCQEPFIAEIKPGAAMREEAIPVVEMAEESQPARKPMRAAQAVAASRDDDDGGAEYEGRRPRRGKRRRASPELPVGLIVGGIALGVCLLGGIVVAAFLFWRSSGQAVIAPPPAEANQSTQQASLPAQALAAQSSEQSAQTAAKTSGWEVTLSDAKFIRQIPHNRFTVEYRFERGAPSPGTHYFLIIESDQGGKARVDYNWTELANMGSMTAESFGGGMGLMRDQGPYTMYIESGIGLGLGGRRRISNSVRTDGKPVNSQPPPQTNTPASQNPGNQATSPPPKVERKPLTDADITKVIEDLKSGDKNRIRTASINLSIAPAGEIPAARIPEIAKALEAVLVDTDMSMRQSAAAALEKCATVDQVPALIKGLDDSHWPVRHSAIRTLGRLKDQRAAAPLAKWFQQQGERGMVADALKKIGGPDAEKAMLRALRDSDLFVRQSAAQVLKEIGTKDSLAALETAAASDSDFGVKSMAADAARAIKARSR